jgi:O-antigen/teichoic acid export membrane protein
MFSVIFSLTGRYGVVGAAIAALAGALATQIIYVVKLRQEIRFGLFLILRESILPLLASLVMGVVLYWLKTFIQINNQVLLIVFVFLGALVYFITLLMLDRLFGKKLTDSLLWIKQNI